MKLFKHLLTQSPYNPHQDEKWQKRPFLYLYLISLLSTLVFTKVSHMRYQMNSHGLLSRMMQKKILWSYFLKNRPTCPVLVDFLDIVDLLLALTLERGEP